MAKKKSTISKKHYKQLSLSSKETIINRFIGFTGTTIAVIQSAYMNRDVELIRQLMNKDSSVSPQSLLGYGRQSFQYTRIMANPDKSDKRIFRDKYNIKLTNNPVVNVDLGSTFVKKVKQPTTPPINIQKIIKPFNFQYKYNVKALYHQILNKDLNDIQKITNLLSKLRFNKIALDELINTYQIVKVRAFMKLKSDSNEYIIVSTLLLPIVGFYDEFKKFFAKYTLGYNATIKGIIEYQYDKYYKETSTTKRFKINEIQDIWVNFYVKI